MSLRILKTASTAALMGAGLTVALASPSHAAVSCNPLGSAMFGAGYTCLAGDKLYSEFTIIEDPGNRLFDGSYTIADNDPSHSLTGSGSFSTGTYSFSYRMQVVGPNAINREFGSISTSGSSSAIPGPNTFSKTLSAESAGPVTTGPATAFFPGGPNPSPLATFSPGVKDAIFTSTLTVTGGVAQVFTDDITQTQLDKTPGPLSILGAGAAFGFSRKMRRRIKQAA
ncbi:hypothetical protein NZK32_05865 [Cyanobium sp. FGCU-52]|nr:hypothetical protein [Cyanobium sp. FGCU52]